MTGRSQDVTKMTREPRDFPWSLHCDTTQNFRGQTSQWWSQRRACPFRIDFRNVKLIHSSNLHRSVHPPLRFQDTTRVEQPHMDVENEPRGGSGEGVEETNMPQGSASVSENRLCEPNIGRARTTISTSGIDRPHGDAGQGE